MNNIMNAHGNDAKKFLNFFVNICFYTLKHIHFFNFEA
jgi:hypothetical protein